MRAKSISSVLLQSHAGSKNGTNTSLRDIARWADFRLATLLRHFPTREGLFEALLCKKMGALALKAGKIETSKPPHEALVSWFREVVAFTHSYRGVADTLRRKERHADMDGEERFALISGLSWLVRQPAFAPWADLRFDIITSAILRNRPSNDVEKKRAKSDR